MIRNLNPDNVSPRIADHVLTTDGSGEVRVFPARVIRYRRDRVRFDEDIPGLEIVDPRWLP